MAYDLDDRHEVSGTGFDPGGACLAFDDEFGGVDAIGGCTIGIDIHDDT